MALSKHILDSKIRIRYQSQIINRQLIQVLTRVFSGSPFPSLKNNFAEKSTYFLICIQNAGYGAVRLYFSRLQRRTNIWIHAYWFVGSAAWFRRSTKHSTHKIIHDNVIERRDLLAWKWNNASSNVLQLLSQFADPSPKSAYN